MRGIRTWAGAAVLAAGVACGGDSTAPAIDSGAGTWTGETNGVTLRLNLRDVAGDLRGDASLTPAGGQPTSFTVLDGHWTTGSNKVHALSLTFSGTSSTPVTFTCTTLVAERCDGPLHFVDGNNIYFEIVR